MGSSPIARFERNLAAGLFVAMPCLAPPPSNLPHAAAAALTAWALQWQAVHRTQTGHDSTCGFADASEVSAAGQAHVVPDVAVANERTSEASAAPVQSEASPVLPLLVVVIGLAVAAVWFVALPQLDKPARVERSCEVIVLKSGKGRCVANPKARSNAAPQKAKPATRSKQ